VGAHDPFPQVPKNAGDSLHNLQLFTITFDGYVHRDSVERFGDWIVGSSWLDAVGSDFNVHSGTHVAKVHLAETAPRAITDDQIQQFLTSKLNDGTLLPPGASIPGTADVVTEPLYVIYYPANVTISLPSGPGQTYQSCREFGGYHEYFHYTPAAGAGGLAANVAYAVLPTCGSQGGMSELDGVTVSSSHEIIEAATDPYPWNGQGADTSGYALQDYSSPWTFIPGEVGDLCVAHNIQDPSGFLVQQSWSNTAAAAVPGRSPCVPDDGTPFFSVSTDLLETQVARAGQTVTYAVHAWSDRPTAGKWYVGLQMYQGSFQPAYELTTEDGQTVTDQTNPRAAYVQMGNGDVATLTVTVPAGTTQQNYSVMEIISMDAQSYSYNYWPIGVFVQ
jgi:hypothetical protein